MRTKIKNPMPGLFAAPSRSFRLRTIAVVLGVATLLQFSQLSGASAAGGAKVQTEKAAVGDVKVVPKIAPQAEVKKVGSLAEQYCKSIRDAASEARFSFQAAELKALVKQIDERVVQLEMRSTELKDWFARREEFSKQASAHLVSIYAAMRPEAAAEQLSKMDETAAAAILSRLEARVASTILNDISPEKAARLATILTGASRKNDRGDKS